MKIGLLGLQGAFINHVPKLEAFSVKWTVIREAPFPGGLDGLIIPGGESTVMMKFLRHTELGRTLTGFAYKGYPVWGICAGAAVLSSLWESGGKGLGLIDMAVRRNAKGHHENSGFQSVEYADCAGNGFSREMFIRAPQITRIGKDVEVLGRSEGGPVWIRQNNIFATTFHPELGDENRVYDFFLKNLNN